MIFQTGRCRHWTESNWPRHISQLLCAASATSSYKRAANPNIPAPIAPRPTATWFAAPVGVAVAEAADALPALAAEDAAELALEAAELRDALALEAAELKEADALDAREEAADEALDARSETELLALAAAPVPVAVELAVPLLADEVQVADAGNNEEAETGSQMLWAYARAAV